MPSADEAQPATVRPPKRRVGGLVAGAVFAAALAVALVWLAGRRPDAVPASEGSEERLLALAADLAAKRPDLFGSFVPLSVAERRGADDGVHGGVALHEPSGVVEEDRPAFRWSAPAGASGTTVTVRRADGVEAWTRPADSAATLPFPKDAEPLARGQDYFWEVSAHGPVGPVVGLRAFHVASEVERSQTEEALALLHKTPDPDLRALAAAHYLARRGWLRRAQEEAAAYLKHHPTDADALDLLRHIVARRGLSPDAPASASDR